MKEMVFTVRGMDCAVCPQQIKTKLKLRRSAHRHCQRPSIHARDVARIQQA
jgi:hypothetical protein